jgi:hypothetical protein
MLLLLLLLLCHGKLCRIMIRIAVLRYLMSMADRGRAKHASEWRCVLWIDGRRDWIDERSRLSGQVFAILRVWKWLGSLPYGRRVGSVRGYFELCVERSFVTVSASTFQPIPRLHRRDQWVSRHESKAELWCGRSSGYSSHSVPQRLLDMEPRPASCRRLGYQLAWQ